MISLFRPSRPAARDTPFRQERARFDPWHPVVGVLGHGYKAGTHACEEILRARPVLALRTSTVKCLQNEREKPLDSPIWWSWAALAFLADVKSGRSRTEPENSGTPPWIGTLSWELGLCPPEHGSPSLAAAFITCGGVESRLQRKGCDSDFQQNEAQKVTLVTSTPAPRMLIPL